LRAVSWEANGLLFIEAGSLAAYLPYRNKRSVAIPLLLGTARTWIKRGTFPPYLRALLDYHTN